MISTDTHNRKNMHKEKELILKNGDKIMCDLEISPIVKWLNDFNNVSTYASCQGDLTKEYPAYIHFSVSDDYNVLVQILRDLSIYYYREYVTVEVGYDPVMPKRLPELKYTMYIKNRECQST